MCHQFSSCSCNTRFSFHTYLTVNPKCPSSRLNYRYDWVNLWHNRRAFETGNVVCQVFRPWNFSLLWHYSTQILIRWWHTVLMTPVIIGVEWGKYGSVHLADTDSDNGLSPDRHEAIIWTYAGIFLIRPLGTTLSEIFIKIQTFSFKKIHLKMSSGKCRTCCLGNVFTPWHKWQIANIAAICLHVKDCQRIPVPMCSTRDC